MDLFRLASGPFFTSRRKVATVRLRDKGIGISTVPS